MDEFNNTEKCTLIVIVLFETKAAVLPRVSVILCMLLSKQTIDLYSTLLRAAHLCGAWMWQWTTQLYLPPIHLSTGGMRYTCLYVL